MLPKQRLRGHGIRHLDERAIFTERTIERIVLLVGKFLRLHEAPCERHIAKVEHALEPRAVAEATRRVRNECADPTLRLRVLTNCSGHSRSHRSDFEDAA